MEKARGGSKFNSNPLKISMEKATWKRTTTAKAIKASDSPNSIHVLQDFFFPI